MKKLSISLIVLLLITMGAFAQTTGTPSQSPSTGTAVSQPQAAGFPFTISPLSITAVLSKPTGGIQNLIQWPIVFAYPPGTTNGPTVWQVWTPAYPQGKTITFSKQYGVLSPGETDNVIISVNVNDLPIGQYSIPISVTLPYAGVTQSIQLTLSIIDDRQYVFPSTNTRVVPHLASGLGWKTILQFTNPSNVVSLLEVKFYAPDGTLTPFRLRDGRNTAIINIPVSGYGTSSIVLEDLFNPRTLTGSAEINPILNAPVGVTIIYQTTDAIPHEAALPALPVNSDTLTLFYDNTNEQKTGLAISNYLNYYQVINLEFYDEGGYLLATTNLSLNPKGQTSFVVNDVIPAINGRQGVIRITSPFKSINGFVLRFNKNFQFIPVTPF